MAKWCFYLQKRPRPTAFRRKLPWPALVFLAALALLCLLADVLAPGEAGYMDAAAAAQSPSAAHLLGTDALGRDVLAMLLHGGRASLCIGLGAAAISAAIGSLYGCLAALCPAWLEDLLLRGAELLLSLPGILLAILLQAAPGAGQHLDALPSHRRDELDGNRQNRAQRGARAAGAGVCPGRRSMGGGFFYLLFRHFAPAFFSSIAFQVVSGIGGAIGLEATLSFLASACRWRRSPGQPARGLPARAAHGAVVDDSDSRGSAGALPAQLSASGGGAAPPGYAA